MKTSSINVKVDEKLKSNALDVLDSLGLSLTNAIRIYLTQIVLTDGIPFEIKRHKHNEETLSAINEAILISEDKIFSKSYKSFEEALEDLDLDEQINTNN